VFRKTIFAALAALAMTDMGAKAEGPAREAGIALHDGLVWTNVECGGTTLHFVVDTGAASSCIDLAATRRLGMRLGPALNVAGVGGLATGYRCGEFEGSVGGMRLPREVVALDLSGPSRGCSERIDGLIGADFFRGKVMRIDYEQKVLSRLEGNAGGAGIPLRLENGVMCVPVAVDGGAARWTRLDTGCTEALYWCEGAGSIEDGGKWSVALASLAGREIQAEVRIGTEEMKNVPVRMREGEIFPGEAGLLGNGALSRYRVTIDGIGMRLVLEPQG
jgi:hypothetical protein